MEAIREHLPVMVLVGLLVGEAILAIRWDPRLFDSGLPVYRRAWRLANPTADFLALVERHCLQERRIVSRQLPLQQQLLLRGRMGLRWQLFLRATVRLTPDGTAILAVRLAWWVLAFIALIASGLALAPARTNTSPIDLRLPAPLAAVDLNVLVMIVLLAMIVALGVEELLPYIRCARRIDSQHLQRDQPPSRAAS